MKFSCNQQQLTKALNIAAKAVTNHTTIPILKGFLLTAEETGILKIASSDLDLSIETKIPVSVSEPGSIVVSARLFGDIIRKLPNEEIQVEESENNVTIKCISSEFRIVGQPSDEFPGIMEAQETNAILLKTELLKEMIRKTSFSASIEEAKGIITGVLFEMKKDSLTLVALDGFRMAVAKEYIGNEEEKNIVIPARILNEINKILGESSEEEFVKIILDDKKAIFILENTKIVLRLLEGDFIRYKDILPKENQCRLKINRGEFLESIERASLLAKEGKNNLIKLSISEDKIIITSRSEEGNVKEEVFIEKEGTDLEIGFNAKYIIDVLKAVSEEELIMEFNNGVSPCLIKPMEGEAFEYLVLPVRISA